MSTNFYLDRADYLRVNSNILTRLTVNAFLGSITFTTFAVLLPSTISSRGLDMGTVLLLGAEALLGMATMLFLLTVFTISIMLLRLGSIDAATRQALVDGTPAIELNVFDKSILSHTCELSMAIVPVTSWGVGGILASMLLIGFYVHVIVGAIIVVAFLIAVFQLRKLWSLLFPPHLEIQTVSQPQGTASAWVQDIKSWFARLL